MVHSLYLAKMAKYCQVGPSWAKLGQNWAKIGPSWAKIGPNAIGVPIVIVETCPFGSRLKAQAQGLETLHNILKWLMQLPLTMKEHFFNDSPKLSICMLVGYQGHFR